MHQLAARSLTEPCRVGLVSYCPTMDLIATVTSINQGDGQKAKDTVDVWKLGGSTRAFGATFENGKEQAEAGAGGEGRQGTQSKDKERSQDAGIVTALSWRRDGRILAVACIDGTVSLIDSFTGKIAYRFNVARSLQRLSTAAMSSSFSSSHSSQPRARAFSSSDFQSETAVIRSAMVTSISWTKHFAYPHADAVRSRLAEVNESDSTFSLDQVLDGRADAEKVLDFAADLPRTMSGLDIEDSLPKLATLPPLGAAVDDDVFSSRASIDAIFHSDTATGSGCSGIDGVDALLSGIQTDYGICAVDIKIFDSFEIGAIDVEGRFSGRPGIRRVLNFDSHPFLSTVFLFVEHSESLGGLGPYSLNLVSLDLSFIPQTGRDLSLVATKATRLGNLLRYITQIQAQLSSEVNAAFELPARFLRNINESLAEGGDPDANFAYAAHHLAATGECLPRFKEWLVDEVGERGLKRWEKAVGDCLELVRRMTHENLQPALERCQVILSRLHGLAMYGPTSAKLGLNEKDVQKAIEVADALHIHSHDLLLAAMAEIQEFTAFMKWMKFECEVQALEDFSERAEELRESWTGENELMTVLEYVRGTIKETRLKKYIGTNPAEQEVERTSATFEDEFDAGFFKKYMKRKSDGKPLPSLRELADRLQYHSEVVFLGVADTFKKSILVKHLIEFPTDCDGETMDTRIIPEPEDASLFHLLAVYKDCNEMGHFHIVVTTLRVEGGTTPKQEGSRNVTGRVPGAEEEVIDVKFVDDTTYLILAATALNVTIYEGLIDADTDFTDMECRQVFEQGRMFGGMKPAHLEVNGREGRRTVTVVDEAGMGFEVFDLDD